MAALCRTHGRLTCNPKAQAGLVEGGEGARRTNSQPDDVASNVKGLCAHAQLAARLALGQALDHVKEDLEKHDGGAVVEQALTLHQHAQPLRRPGCTQKHLFVSASSAYRSNAGPVMLRHSTDGAVRRLFSHACTYAEGAMLISQADV